MLQSASTWAITLGSHQFFFQHLNWLYLQLHNSIILYTHRPVCPCMLALPFAVLCLFCLKQRLLYMGFNSSLEHVHENLGGAICCEHGWTIARCMLERLGQFVFIWLNKHVHFISIHISFIIFKIHSHRVEFWIHIFKTYLIYYHAGSQALLWHSNVQHHCSRLPPSGFPELRTMFGADVGCRLFRTLVMEFLHDWPSPCS